MAITLNPCDAYFLNSPSPINGNLFGNDNLTLTSNNISLTYESRGTVGQSSGKYYYEIFLNLFNSGNSVYFLGLIPLATALTGATADGENAIAVMQGSTAHHVDVWVNGSKVLTNSATMLLTEGHTMCFAVDLDNKLFWVREDGGNWNANNLANPSTGVGGFDISAIARPMAPCVLGSHFHEVTGSFGDQAFSFPCPAGFNAGWSDHPGTPGVDIPRNLVASDPAGGSSTTLTWTAPTLAPVSYTVTYRKVTDTLWTTVDSILTTSYVVTGLESGTTYLFRVAAAESGRLPALCGYSGQTRLVMPIGEPLALHTAVPMTPVPITYRDFRVVMDTQWSENGELCILSVDPAPVTITATIPEVEVGDTPSQ